MRAGAAAQFLNGDKADSAGDLRTLDGLTGVHNVQSREEKWEQKDGKIWNRWREKLI